MKTKKEVMDIAKAQLALDYSCKIEDFEKKENTFNVDRMLEGRRLGETDGNFLKILTIGGRAIISGDEKIQPWIEEHFMDMDANWMFEIHIFRAIDNKLKEFNQEIEEMKIFYLPNPEVQEVKPLYEIKWFEKDDIKQFEDDNRFRQAFIFHEESPDYLGVAAMDGDTIMGMAGASINSEKLYEVGIDVVEEYRGRGIASNLVSILKQELMRRGKVPFYGTVASHLPSRNVAINAGFIPAWAEMYSKEIEE